MFAKSDKQLNSGGHKVKIERLWMLFMSVPAGIDVTLATQIVL